MTFGIPDTPMKGLGTTVRASDLLDAPAREARGLVGPMPAKFTPEQTAQTLASLVKNQPNYLPTPQRSGTRHTVDGQYVGGGEREATTEYFEPAGTPTRAQSRDERESMARQIAVSEEADLQRIGDENRQIALDKEIAEQAYAADEAERKRAFFDQYGVEPLPQAVSEIVKHNSKSAIYQGVAQDMAQFDVLEAQAIQQARAEAQAAAQTEPSTFDPKTGLRIDQSETRSKAAEAAVRSAFDQKRRLRLIAMGFTAGESAGGALNQQKSDPFADAMASLSPQSSGGPR